MALFPLRNSDWWGPKIDSSGTPLRDDVYQAAQAIWPAACQRAQKQLGDTSEAAELMDRSVAQISRYLDQRQTPLDSKENNVQGLLMENFQKALLRHKRRQSRFELFDDPDTFVDYARTERWDDDLNLDIDKRRLLSFLCPRARDFFRLRIAGYDWKYIAGFYGISIARAKVFYANAWRQAKKRYLKSIGAQG